jgi:ribosomal-protein-alanine N-acetyltransferase
VTIRRATDDDLPAIGLIQGASSWKPAAYLNYDCRVAIVDNLVAGFVVSRETAPGEREILNIAVAPARRRQGIAKRLLEAEIAGSCGTWFLEVRESNSAAINLYKTLGFQPAGHRQDYYNDPTEAAIVMRFFS